MGLSSPVIPFDGDLKRKLESLLSDEKKEQKQGLLKTGEWKLENRKQKKKKKKLKYGLYMGL